MPSSVCLSGSCCADGAEISVGVVRLKGFGGSGNRWGWWGLADNDPWPVVRCPAPRLPVFPSSCLPVFLSSCPQRGREICRRGENLPPSDADLRKVPPSRRRSLALSATKRATGADAVKKWRSCRRASGPLPRNSTAGLPSSVRSLQCQPWPARCLPGPTMLDTHPPATRRTGPTTTRYDKDH